MKSDASVQLNSSLERGANFSAFPSCVLYICNDLTYFAAHRASIAESLVKAGARVHVCAAASGSPAGMLPAGIVFHPVGLERHSFALVADLSFMRSCRALVRNLKPDIVHLITMKPNVYGGLALALGNASRPPRVVMTFPGLGRIFENGQGLGGRLRRLLTLSGLRFGARALDADATFENMADRNFLVKQGVFALERTHLTFGAGIATNKFQPAAEPRMGRLTYLFASRLLNAKGLGVFIEAARLRRLQGSGARFLVAGSFEHDNPDSFSPKTLEAAADAGIVDYLGSVDGEDIPDLLRSVDVVCLPTRLSEGFPRILIEAAACGCALIASRQPSVAQIIQHGETGCMIDPKDASDLLAVMEKFDDEPALARRMGVNAAAIARRMPVDEAQVNAAFMALYRLDI